MHTNQLHAVKVAASPSVNCVWIAENFLSTAVITLSQHTLNISSDPAS